MPKQIAPVHMLRIAHLLPAVPQTGTPTSFWFRSAGIFDYPSSPMSWRLLGCQRVQ